MIPVKLEAIEEPRTGWVWVKDQRGRIICDLINKEAALEVVKRYNAYPAAENLAQAVETYGGRQDKPAYVALELALTQWKEATK